MVSIIYFKTNVKIIRVKIIKSKKIILTLIILTQLILYLVNPVNPVIPENRDLRPVKSLIEQIKVNFV